MRLLSGAVAREERSAEVDGAPIDREQARRVVERILLDRVVAPKARFLSKGKKALGVSAGYVAVDQADGSTSLLKSFHKSYSSITALDTPQSGFRATHNYVDNITEYAAGAMFRLLLYDRAPKIALVTPDAPDESFIYVRSKFFKNAIDLYDYTESAPKYSLVSRFSELTGYGSNKIDPEHENASKIQGLEKVLAACHILGDKDYHGRNLMVNTETLDVLKIDHGKSFQHFDAGDFGSFLQQVYDVNTHVRYNSLQKLNIDAYAGAMRDMLERLGEEQVRNVVHLKIDELKKAGLDPKGMEMPIFGEKVSINDIEHLGDVMIAGIGRHLSKMREFAAQLDLVSRFEGMDDNFKNGGWLQALCEYKGAPKEYADSHNISIAGEKKLLVTKDSAICAFLSDPKVLELFPRVVQGRASAVVDLGLPPA